MSSVWEIGENQGRVRRGGSWVNLPEDCRSAFRGNNNPDYRDSFIGFRVVCVPASTP